MDGEPLIDTKTLLFVSNSGYQLSPQLKIIMFTRELNTDYLLSTSKCFVPSIKNRNRQKYY